MEAVETLAPKVGTQEACLALGIPRANIYRQRGQRHRPPVELWKRPSPPRALPPLERQEVLEVLHSDRFVDQAPREVFAALLDEGRYLCSIRTMYRLLEANQEVRDRRNQLRHP